MNKLSIDEEFQKKMSIFVTGTSLFLWFILNKLFLLTKETADQESSITNIVKCNTILEQKIEEILTKNMDECVTTTSSTVTVNKMTSGLDENDEDRTRSRSKSRISKAD